MIGKIHSGRHFGTAIDYITAVREKDKKSTILLHSDGVLCTDNKTMAECLEAYARKGQHNLASPVKHISLSFSPQDAPRLTDDLMAEIAKEYMKLMGISDTEFVICRHHDKQHPHCHLVFSRVNRRGRLISDGNEKMRNVRVCKLLTEKYGLYMPQGRERVNEDRLRGSDRIRYDMAAKVLACRESAADWDEFDKRLKAVGIRLRFHFNNVDGRLMGVSFTDGRHSYSGKRLDGSLVLSKLSERFGDLRQLAHDNVRSWYEAEKDRLLDLNCYDERSTRNIERAFPPFDEIYPRGISDVPAPDGRSLLSLFPLFGAENGGGEPVRSADGASSYVPLGLLAELLIQPYHAQLSAGGGGGGGSDSRGWRDREDERERFRFNFKKTEYYQHSRGRKR